MSVDCNCLWDVLHVDGNSIVSIFGLVRLDQPSNKPGVLAETLKNDEEVVEGTVDVFHVIW